MPTLAEHPLFADLPDAAKAVAFFEANGHGRYLEATQPFMQPGQPADDMVLVLDGELESTMPVQGGGSQFVANWKQGEVMGVLPYSRMRETNLEIHAGQPTHLWLLNREHFKTLIHEYPELTQHLVERMTQRVREFTTATVQESKMMALGQMAAGLTHDLNNPAAAISRMAAQWQAQLETQAARWKRIAELTPPEQAIEVIKALAAPPDVVIRKMSPLERADAEDDLAVHLATCVGQENALRIAPTLAETGFNAETTEHWLSTTPQPVHLLMLEWLVEHRQMLAASQGLASAAARISHLVVQMKTYSHMDQAADLQPSSLGPGLESTAELMQPRFRDKAVKLDLQLPPDLPEILAYPGALNQVWTNLLDNALDATPTGGHVQVRAGADGEWVWVEIEDSGAGITQEVQARMFDPFFTTKPVGQGSGLGLDMVQTIIRRHQGRLEFTSEPGQTIFKVCLRLVETANER